MPSNPVLVVGQAQKASGDAVRIPIDWGDVPQVITLLTDANGNYVPTNTAITNYSVTCTDPGGPTIGGIRLDYPYVLSAMVSGGTGGGKTYNLVYSVTLNDADSTLLSRTGTIIIF